MKAVKAGIFTLGGFVAALVLSHVLLRHAAFFVGGEYMGMEGISNFAQAFGIWTLVFVVLWRK